MLDYLKKWLQGETGEAPTTLEDLKLTKALGENLMVYGNITFPRQHPKVETLLSINALAAQKYGYAYVVYVRQIPIGANHQVRGESLYIDKNGAVVNTGTFDPMYCNIYYDHGEMMRLTPRLTLTQGQALLEKIEAAMNTWVEADHTTHKDLEITRAEIRELAKQTAAVSEIDDEPTLN